MTLRFLWCMKEMYVTRLINNGLSSNFHWIFVYDLCCYSISFSPLSLKYLENSAKIQALRSSSRSSHSNIAIIWHPLCYRHVRTLFLFLASVRILSFLFAWCPWPALYRIQRSSITIRYYLSFSPFVLSNRYFVFCFVLFFSILIITFSRYYHGFRSTRSKVTQ